jgi:hypothetical protein
MFSMTGEASQFVRVLLQGCVRVVLCSVFSTFSWCFFFNLGQCKEEIPYRGGRKRDADG